MHKSKERSTVWYLVIILSLLGVLFRDHQLSGGSPVLLIGYGILVLLAFALCALALPPQKEWKRVFLPDRADTVLSILGALAVGAACVMTMTEKTFAGLVSGGVGILGAACMALSAVFRLRADEPKLFAYVLPVLGFVLRLFFSFRVWMLDPSISDYCVQLFAMISFMLAFYSAAEFCLDKGHRRRLCFFALTSVFFGAMAVSGQPVGQMLYYGGSAVAALALTRRTLN